MKKLLPQSFFKRRTLIVAEDLIGKFLVRRIRGKETAYMITETEAYDGFDDKASHAHRGKTSRNFVMFGEAGHIYVYLTYGLHHMFNIVTSKNGYPAAVLIRAVESISGPGRLTKQLKITKTLNTKIFSKETGLWVEDRGVRFSKKNIKKVPRVGIRYAEEWEHKPYRFLLSDNLH